ncbi:zinc-dependent dehydrogenase [Arcanobacterium haemolyticum]|nr:zinc-dependent dehydrogenase [Arcanobacterium haemolyticum]
MKAAVFDGPGKLELREIDTPHARAGELVLKVGANTLCGTDGRILRGEKTAGIDIGVVLGHEISGYVTEIGSGVDGFAEGDLVAINPTVPCLRCYYCKAGLDHLCEHTELFGYAINGGLAEYIRIPAQAMERGGVYRAPAHVSAVEAALSEPTGCVLNGASNYKPQPGDTVVIIGAGPIGMLHTQVNKLYGASQIIVSDLSESRLAMAKKLGATHTVNAGEANLKEFVFDHTEGRGADVAVLCIGANALVQQGFEVVRKRGHVNAFAGFPKGGSSSIDPNLIHYRELEVTGASNANRASQEKALRLIGEGKIDVKALHTDTYKLDDVVEAIEYAASGKGVKVAVVPE